jgi:hypothetical protein
MLCRAVGQEAAAEPDVVVHNHSLASYSCSKHFRDLDGEYSGTIVEVCRFLMDLMI